MSLRATLLPGATFAPNSTICTALSTMLDIRPPIQISEAEKEFIEGGILQDCRLDGRTLKEIRQIKIETDVISKAYGSARILTNESELYVGVQCEPLEILETGPQEGNIFCSVDCSAFCDLQAKQRNCQSLGDYLGLIIEDMCLGPNCVERSKLTIVERRLVWNIYVSVVVFEGSGNLIDIISIGVKAALKNTKLPKITVNYNREMDCENDNFDFDIDKNPESGTPFPAESIPLCVTAYQIKGCFVWDLLPEESHCFTSSCIVAVNSEGNCLGSYKIGNQPMDTLALISALQKKFLEFMSNWNQVSFNIFLKKRVKFAN